jgi:hypothetical protein
MECEIRNMTLQTLACGVRMVFWWAYGPMKEAQEWPVYAEMIRGTTALAPMLWGVEPERRREGDVCFSRFVSPKGEVVIAVNLADRSATASLPWADTPNREMPFGFGCARNGLSLELEPYGCAIWTNAPVPAAGAVLAYEVPESEKAAFDLDTLAYRRATGAVALPYAAGATLTEKAPDGTKTTLVSAAAAAGTCSWTAASGGAWTLANSLEGSAVFTARYPASAQGAGTVADPAKIVDEDELADLDAGVGYVFRPCGADGLLDALEIPDGCVLASLGGGLYRLDVADGDCVCGADGAVFPLETAQTGPDRRMKTALKFLPFAYSGDDWGFDPVAASVLTFTSPTSAETAVACVGTGSLTPSFRLTSGVWTVALSGASSLSARIDIPNDGTFLKMR